MTTADLESGDNLKQNLKSHKIRLLRTWRFLPRILKTVIIVIFVLSLTSFCIFFLAHPRATTPLSNNKPHETQPLIHTNSGPNVANPHPVIKTPPANKRLQPLAEQNSLRRREGSGIWFGEDEISFERDILPQRELFNGKQKKIVAAMIHSWEGYRKYAWGHDTLKPISKTSSTWFGVGLTLIDSLDTLILMGMRDEYMQAIEWIRDSSRFDVNRDVNCFEMTIRVLGGLLSSYHLTKEKVFLDKAIDVGSRLIHCFDTTSNLVPYSDVNLRTRSGKTPLWSPFSTTAEVSTMQLEFRDLSRLSGQPIYEETSFRTSQHLHNLTVDDPLVPMFINPDNGQFSHSTVTIGARGDSYYEYLLKQYLQTSVDWLLEDYIRSIDAIENRMIRTTNGQLKLAYVAEILSRASTDSSLSPKMDHLVCFLPGTLSLGQYHCTKSSEASDNHLHREKINHHLVIAESLARTCYHMYNLTATGLAPEIAYFNNDENPGGQSELIIRPADTHNLLRPEYVESLFYLYHITKNEMYREQGWAIFNAFEKHCKVPSGGYTSIGNVRNPNQLKPRDMMESFWTAETLKYLFLLFSDDQNLVEKILNNYIFNTEGHLIKRTV